MVPASKSSLSKGKDVHAGLKCQKHLFQQSSASYVHLSLLGLHTIGII